MVFPALAVLTIALAGVVYLKWDEPLPESIGASETLQRAGPADPAERKSGPQETATQEPRQDLRTPEPVPSAEAPALGAATDRREAPTREVNPPAPVYRSPASTTDPVQRNPASSGGAAAGASPTTSSARDRQPARDSASAAKDQTLFVDIPRPQQRGAAADSADGPVRPAPQQGKASRARGSAGSGIGRTGDPETTATPQVLMMPASGEVLVGDRVSITVAISSATNVGHVPFHVTFNPGVLQFDHAEEGSFLGSDGIPTAFFAAATSSGAEVVIGLSRLGQEQGNHGGGNLCVLHFNAVGPGDAGLGFASAKVRDSTNRIVPASFRSATVVVR